jgi:hypothetical protein
MVICFFEGKIYLEKPDIVVGAYEGSWRIGNLDSVLQSRL